MGLESKKIRNKEYSHQKESLFNDIYKEYFRIAVFYANQYLQDKETAKEIVQDTFLSLWEHIEELDTNLNIKAYILKITRNKCLNIIRKQKYSNKYLDYINQENRQIHGEALSDISAEECLDFEIKDLLEKSLNQMSDDVRISFCMNRYEHYSCPEIADNFHISSRTVESRIAKALLTLKMNFKDYFAENE